MQIDHAQEQCHHKGCTCTVANEHRYCSDHCRIAAEGQPTREEKRVTCACGHEACQAASPPPAHKV